MIDASRLAFWVPPELKTFKRKLFDRIAHGIAQHHGKIYYEDYKQLARLSKEQVPVVGCSPYIRPLIDEWVAEGRTWIYWDRGYFRRVFATDLKRGANGGYYRWHINEYQMSKLRPVNSLRWKMMDQDVWNWQKDGKHIVVAAPSDTYMKFHAIQGWVEKTVAALKQYTDRPLVIRDKEMQASGKRPLHIDLKHAHCLVTHGSNAAVEAVIMGCPVFVEPAPGASAAALVGLTDLSKIETPIYPDRTPWLHSLAHCQFNEGELVNGKLWRSIE